MAYKEIEDMMEQGRMTEALALLDRAVEADPGDARLWYLRGRVHWCLQHRGQAISDYEEAVHLDPDGPAVHALALVRGIMDFYNPDMFNP